MSVLILAEQGMGLKGLRRFLFVANDFGGFVKIQFATIVAAHAEASINRRRRGNGIGYSERNPVPVKQILTNMIEMIFAQHYPAILSIFPHWNLPEPGLPNHITLHRTELEGSSSRVTSTTRPRFSLELTRSPKPSCDRSTTEEGRLSTCPLTLTIRLAPLISLHFQQTEATAQC